MGSFIIDSDDGELIFRLANNVDGGIINGSIVRICLFQVFLCLQQSYEDIMKAMYGGPQMTFTFASEDRPSRAS